MENKVEGCGMRKPQALLYMYKTLITGGVIKKKEFAQEIKVSTKTVERYVEEINRSLQEDNDTGGVEVTVKYDKKEEGYIIKSQEKLYLSKKDILTIAKILLESRGLSKNGMDNLLKKLVANCYYLDKSFIREVIFSEKANYIEPKHGDEKLVDKIWDISQAIRENRRLLIAYTKVGNCGKIQDKLTERKLIPHGLLFSEYYFYLIASIDKGDDTNMEYKIPYRLDRIKDYEVLDERIDINSVSKFEEGQFRRQIHFMYSGDLQIVEFKFKGRSIEAVQDKLPMAVIIDKGDGEYIVRTRVSGNGIKMWLLSQGDAVEVLEPKWLRKEMSETVKRMMEKYN